MYFCTYFSETIVQKQPLSQCISRIIRITVCTFQQNIVAKVLFSPKNPFYCNFSCPEREKLPPKLLSPKRKQSRFGPSFLLRDAQSQEKLSIFLRSFEGQLTKQRENVMQTHCFWQKGGCGAKLDKSFISVPRLSSYLQGFLLCATIHNLVFSIESFHKTRLKLPHWGDH